MAIFDFLVPLTNIPQVFVINLSGNNYYMTVKWNDSMDAGWVMDLADASQNPIACNLPLVTGTDILAGLEYLGIDGSFFVFTNGDLNAVPTLDNLGNNSNLHFQTTVPNG